MKKILLLVGVLSALLLLSSEPAYSRPAAPSLTAPFNGARMSSFNPTLQWASPAGAAVTQVHLQVIPHQNNGPGVDLILSPDNGQFTLPEPPQWYGLLPDMSYSWRVRVSDATEAVGVDDPSWSDWSTVWSFRTPALSAATIQLQSPAPDAVVDSLTPTLVWNDIHPNAWYYEVQVSRDPGFGSSAFLYWELRHGGVTNPPRSYAVPADFPLEPGTRYYWRVRQRVQGDGAPVDWSSALSFVTPGQSSALPTAPGRLDTQVTAILDGGSIEVLVGGARKVVRYLGIHAPGISPPECYGAQAAAKNSELVEGQIVQLERDVTDADPAGHLPRYVYVNGVLVNGELVRGGYARAIGSEPDTRLRNQLQVLEEEARSAGRGLWRACGG